MGKKKCVVHIHVALHENKTVTTEIIDHVTGEQTKKPEAVADYHL